MEQNLKNLLEAEQDVNRRVQDALNNKNKKLQSIKESSKAEIEAFKMEKEKEYQKKYAHLKEEISSGGKDDKSGQTHQSQVTMETIENDYTRNKDRVVDLLVSNVLSVNIEIPKVVKGTF